MREKSSNCSTRERGVLDYDDSLPDIKAGTADDREAMRRLGKEQLFKRNFTSVPILGFAVILMGTWEVLLGTVAFGLGNGGTAGLIYVFIGAWFGFTLVSASMAELASSCPTSGGQYHWVSEYAPAKFQKQASYFIGWVSFLGYQIGVTLGPFLSATMVQGLVVLNYPSYEYKRWHGTLIAMLMTIFGSLFNIYLASFLPIVETISLFLHFAGWIGILVPLWVLAPRTPGTQVWTNFSDAGWGNNGVASLIGMITVVGAFVGGDAPAHMAEEVRDASKLVPRAMLWTIWVNGAMGLVMLITFCYTVGDLDAALTSPTGYPIIEVFHQATKSVGATTALTSILVVLAILNNITSVAGTSRQLFAFARDRGVPGHSWLSKVRPGYDVPINAIIISACISSIFHCINIGSAIAFNILMSAGSAACLASYLVCIGCITWRRFRHQPLLEGRFNMGRMGLIVNVLALAFLVLALVFAFFPPAPHPPPITMNWAIAIFAAVLGIAGIYYFVKGRHEYDGPVAYVRKTV
ncbi:amino acid transporter [Periconia macrospinosa]|uniref:Amino acid transporter n=1 Tax=Periconia macrospinosa TaxID=97972 RepID=A0A2V1EG87_9PLEO|nr:amino acid transporter [Periconia macrospinosa]